MKRTFLARRNALLSSARFSWGAAALLFAIIVLLFRVFFPNAFWRLMEPVFAASDTVSAWTHGFTASFENAAALSEANEQLQNENAALANENRALLEKESAVAGVGTTASGIVAGVVSRPPGSPYDTLVVGKGSVEGVLPAMEAFGPGGVPVGIVTQVLPEFSRVTLFSSPNMTSQAWLGTPKTPVTLTGEGSGAFRATLARLASASTTDMVYVPGPGALPIGSVVRIDSDPSSPSVILQVQSAVNLFSMTWVELRPTGPSFVDSFSWDTAETP